MLMKLAANVYFKIMDFIFYILKIKNTLKNGWAKLNILKPHIK